MKLSIAVLILIFGIRAQAAYTGAALAAQALEAPQNTSTNSPTDEYAGAQSQADAAARSKDPDERVRGERARELIKSLRQSGSGD